MEADHLTPAQLDLRQLASFRAIAETGSFHEAAARLEYTQSAVSQHLASLEAALGVRLVERSRGRRRIGLTEAGELFVRHVDAILGRLRSAQADMRAYREGSTGVLRVGTYQSVGTRLLPAVVGRFGELWPGIEIRLTESPTDTHLLALVEAGELDLAFTHDDPRADGPFDAVELLRDPFVVVVPSDSPLVALRRPVTSAELGELRMVTARACRATERALDAVRRGGCEPRIVFQSDDNGTIQAMVRAGLGAALAPLLAVDTSDPQVAVLPIELPLRSVGLAWHRERFRSPASLAFVDLAREVARGLAAEVRQFRGPESAVTAVASARAGGDTASDSPPTPLAATL